MTDGYPGFFEFRQAYKGGLVVEKRGLDASPLVVGKYGLAEDQVMAFSSWQKRRRAVTVFHFHPSFPTESREPYMRAHSEGHELLDAFQDREAGRRQRRWEASMEKVSDAARKGGRTVRALAGAALLAVINGGMR